MSNTLSTELPAILSAAQAEAMAQRQIKKHVVAVVLLHWFNAVVWFLELATGSAIVVSPQLRFMPPWYLRMMEQAFGSRANLLRFHLAVGSVWILVCAVYGMFGWKHYLHAEVLRKEVALDRDDIQWLIQRTRKMLKPHKAPLPPQGAYNAGQKLYALLVYTMLPLVMLSGIVMMFHLFGAIAVQWAMVLHFVAVGMVVSGLMIHVYMGAVFPEERPAFYSMITGMVSELYAYRHHFKWWAEVKREEVEWGKELQDETEVEQSPKTQAATN